HTRQFPYRTYVITAKVPKESCQDGLYWDTDDPYHYIRTDESDEPGKWLLTAGGEDHKTGQDENSEERFRMLEQWLRKRFPVTDVKYHWSGQVLEPNDGLAFIGKNPGDENVYVV